MTTRVEQTRAEGAAANLSRRDLQNIERDPQSSLNVKGTGISFTNPGTIADSGNGFGVFIVGDRVEVRGRDLCGDLMGRVTFTEYFCLLLTGREPTADQRDFLDLLLVAIAEHDLGGVG